VFHVDLSIAVDDNWRPVVIPVPVAFLPNHGCFVPTAVATVPNAVAITMNLANGHATRTHTDPEFIGLGRICTADPGYRS